MPDPHDRAARYRELAEECRASARSATTKKIREHYLRIAEHYVALADGEEKFTAERQRSKKPAGH